VIHVFWHAVAVGINIWIMYVCDQSLFYMMLIQWSQMMHLYKNDASTYSYSSIFESNLEYSYYSNME
jgi:hypothetical protein